MITRRGIGFVITAVAAFFIASATRVGWVHLADAILWGVLILSAVTPWLSVYGISVQRKNNQKHEAGLAGPVEGQRLDIELGISNRWWIPRFLLNVRYDIESPRQKRTESTLLVATSPRSNSLSSSKPSVTNRGVHDLSEIVVESSGLFGLFRRRRRFAASESVLVYPSWESISQVGLLEASLGVSEGISKSRSGSEVAGTRRYVAGDPYRNIHWRNSARTGRLAVKEFDSWSERSVAIVIDADELTMIELGDHPSDYAVRLAATASFPLIASGGTVRVVAPHCGQIRTTWADAMTDIAQIEDQQPGTSSSWMESVASTERVLAFVHSSNSGLLSTLATMARSSSDIAAVVFEGFMPGDDARHAVNSLRSVGVSAMSCRHGEFSTAVEMMEHGITAQPLVIGATDLPTREVEEVAA